MSAPPTPLVLVVDDVEQIRDLFAKLLRRAGMAVQVAEDGVAALGAVRVRLPDAIVCDIDMPNMGGLAFCQALRADPATQHVPVLILSGSGSTALADALHAGCDVVLPKPCGGALLVETIERLLARSAPPSEPPDL